MKEHIYTELQDLFLALGDKTRLRLLAGLASGPASVGTLVDSIHESQPKVSRHLASLRSMGLVKTERDGKHIYYSIDAPANEPARQIFLNMIGALSAGSGSFPGRLQPSSGAHSGPTTDIHPERGNELEIFLL